jgi:hypothetical protein
VDISGFSRNPLLHRLYREQIDVRLARNKPLLQAGYSDAELLGCNVFPLVTAIGMSVAQ